MYGVWTPPSKLNVRWVCDCSRVAERHVHTQVDGIAWRICLAGWTSTSIFGPAANRPSTGINSDDFNAFFVHLIILHGLGRLLVIGCRLRHDSAFLIALLAVVPVGLSAWRQYRKKDPNVSHKADDDESSLSLRIVSTGVVPAWHHPRRCHPCPGGGKQSRRRRPSQLTLVSVDHR